MKRTVRQAKSGRGVEKRPPPAGRRLRPKDEILRSWESQRLLKAPVMMVSARGHILQLNPEAARETGLPNPRAPGQTFEEMGWQVLDAQARPLPYARRPWARALASRRCVRKAIVGLSSPQKGLQWFQCACTPLHTKGPPVVLVLLDDITTRVHMEKRMAAQLRFEDALAACVNQALCASSFCKNCHAMRHLLELPLAEISGVQTVHLFENVSEALAGNVARLAGAYNCQKGLIPHPPDLLLKWTGPLAAMARRLEDGKAILLAPGSNPRQGREFLHLLNLSGAAVFPLISGGAWLGVLIFGQPSAAHAWTRHDLHLMRLTARLAAGMLGRKRVQEHMLQAQKMEKVGLLASGMAHDFNNVLTGVRSSLQLLLLDVPENSPLRTELESIWQEAGRASDLARRMLSFSRPSRGHPAPVDLNEQIRLLAPVFRRTLAKNIRVETRLSPDGLVALMDPLQFEQALLNLILNARDAMPEGGRLSILSGSLLWDERHPSPIPGARKGEYAWVAVADQGIGIAPSALKKIFEPFYTSKTPGRGTGLGLSMVQAIVQQQNGYALATSRPGKETVFTLYLPRIRKSPPSPGRPPRQSLQPLEGTERILLVDDEPSVLRSTAALLNRYGYTTACASSGARAAALFAEQPRNYALAVLDASMPSMSGRECLRRILKARPGQPVLVISGYGLESLGWNPLKEGAAAFVEKPFELKSFLGLIRRLLDSTRPRQAPPPKQKTGSRPPVAP